MTTHTFDHTFEPTTEQRETFLRDGAVKLEGLLNDEVVEMLSARVTAEMEIGAMPARFSNKRASARLKYDFVSDKEGLYSVVERPYFQRALTELVSRDLFFTFEQGFVVDQAVHTGVDWHVGTQTFGYQPTHEFACTLWCPLTPIDPTDQRGGVAYVPERIFSGRFVYEYLEPGIVATLEGKERDGIATTPDEYFTLRTTAFSSPAIEQILEYHQIEHHFKPGDALLFNKMVPHRSFALEEGPLPSRAAYVFRFVDATSRYDLTRARMLDFPVRTYETYKPVTRQYIEIAEAGAEDGDLLAECSYFDSRERRTIRRDSNRLGIPRHSKSADASEG